MRFTDDGTSRKNQGLTLPSEVRSGYVNMQSLTGVRLWELEEKTRAFHRYDFGIIPDPYIPELHWNRIVAEYFPGCGRFSMKELAKGTPYSDWRSLKRAITACGSEVHFFCDGPIWATAQNSFDAGITRVIEAQQEREQETYFKATLCGSSSIR